MTEIPINKWIYSSIRKHCFDRTKGLTCYIEEQTKDNDKRKQYLEVRIDGPYHSTGTKNERCVYLELNILCSWSYDMKDTLGLVNLTDVATWMLNRDICVFKYGNGDEIFGTLQLITDDKVKVSNFGQIDPHNKVYQATVEAHYQMRYEDVPV